MLQVIDHGDVREYRLSSAVGRAIGLKVSVFRVRGYLVDTGFPRARAAIESILDDGQVRGGLVTHWHEDHSGNVATLARRGVPVMMPAATRGYLDRTRRLPPYRWAIWGNAAAVRGVVDLTGGCDLAMLPTPGHTDDHHAVWDASTGTLFSGDLVLGVRIAAIHLVEDPRATLASVREVIGLAPDRIFDAHRGLLREPAKLLAAKARWLEDTIGAIDGHIRQGRDDRAILAEVFGGEEAVAAWSLGQVSRLNFVRAVRRGHDQGVGGAIR